MSVICFLPFLCNPNYLLYVSTSVWAVRKTVFSSRIFWWFCNANLIHDSNLKQNILEYCYLCSPLSLFYPLPYFSPGFAWLPHCSLSILASSCIVSEVHSHKTWDVPPLGWAWVLMVPEQKSWSTYFYVYGCQLTVTCQGLMQIRRQCFGKAFLANSSP